MFLFLLFFFLVDGSSSLTQRNRIGASPKRYAFFSLVFLWITLMLLKSWAATDVAGDLFTNPTPRYLSYCRFYNFFAFFSSSIFYYFNTDFFLLLPEFVLCEWICFFFSFFFLFWRIGKTISLEWETMCRLLALLTVVINIYIFYYYFQLHVY